MNRNLILLGFFAFVCGLGTMVYKSWSDRETAKKQKETQELKTLEAQEVKEAAEANKKAKEAEARKAENEKKKAEAESKTASDNLSALKIEKENLIQRQKTANAETEAEKKAREAAEAEADRLAAEADASDARRKELEAKSELERLALKRAETEREKAVAEEISVLAKKQIADAALTKSENELKAAKEKAAAERDAKLRLYHRAEGSRAEMLEIRRAERMLAAMEAAERGELIIENGELKIDGGETSVPDVQEGTDGDKEAGSETVDEPKLNLVETVEEVDPLDEAIEEGIAELNRSMAEAQQSVKNSYRKTLERLIEKSEKENKPHNVAYYKRALESLLKEKIED